MEEKDSRYRQGGSLPMWFHRRLQKAEIDRFELLAQLWTDHYGTYRLNNREKAFVACPYDIGKEGLQQLEDLCEKINARYSIRGNSPYGYGTLFILVTPREGWSIDR